MFREFLPQRLAERFCGQAPLRILVDGEEVALQLEKTAPGVLECDASGIRVVVNVEPVADPRAVRWTVTLTNTRSAPIENVRIVPLHFRFKIHPDRDHPRVRHMGGSYHYDGTYPPRAFRLSEERFMTHDHCKVVKIGSGPASAYDHVPLMQFLIGPHGDMCGLFVGFEWSSRWHLQAGWESECYFGQALPDFILQGNVGLETLRLEPGEQMALPRIHMGVFEGEDVEELDNTLRRYVREHIACKLEGRIPLPAVYYDHWFGIHQYFDVADLKRQADVAAGLGCEIFCLDAAWYEVKDSFVDGLGNWLRPDPKKFPNGIEELSEHVRALGMKFGLWHLIELACPGTQVLLDRPELYDSQGSKMSQDPTPGAMTPFHRLRLDKPEGREYALSILRRWVQDWKIDFFRWECSDPQQWAYSHDPSGKLLLAYMNGFYQLIDAVREEFPDIYIEDCEGGGTRLDWGMAVRTHGNWLSDHTAHPEVSRFFQTGASRFWPAHFLTSAVRVQRGAGDIDATSHNMVSRMMGALGFNGDIAQWSPEARARAKEHVRVFKDIRPLLAGPVHFPLDQPRDDQDWDAAIYGDTKTGKQLLFAFRMEGPESQALDIPGDGWTRLLGSENAQISNGTGPMTVKLDKYSSGIWVR